MAYQPTNPHPYMETIDATVANQFSCLVNDRSVLSGATINIWGSEGGMRIAGQCTIESKGDYASFGRLCVTLKTLSESAIRCMMDNGENLYIKDQDSDYIQIIKLEDTTAYDAIFITEKISVVKNQTYNIYTNLSDCIGVPDINENNLFYGGFSNNSCLSHIIDSNTLKNDYDYSWCVDLYSDDYQYVSDGFIVETLTGLSSLRLEDSLDLYNVLLKSNRHFFIKLDDGIYRSMSNFSRQDGSYIYASSITPTFKSPPRAGERYVIYEVPEKALQHCVLRTPKYYFKTRTTPVVTLADIPDTINNGAYTFSATYEQAERTPFSTYQFDLYQDGILIDSSGQQSSRLINYTFESFMNQGNYKIMLTIINDDGVEIIREKSFKVDYTLVNSTIAPVIESDNTNACIKIDYSNHAEIPGKVSKEGAVSFIDDGIHLTQNETVLWDERSDKPLDIPSSSTQVIRWHGDHGFQGKIIEVYDSIYPWVSTSVEFDGTKFIARLNGTTTGESELYEGVASAIVTKGSSTRFENSMYGGDIQIGLASNVSEDKVAPVIGNWIQVNNEHRKITNVEDMIVTIDRPLPETMNGVIDCVVYDENYLYMLNDTDDLSDTDILIDNDRVNKYWWLIIINPEGSENRVEIRKSVLYTESEV